MSSLSGRVRRGSRLGVLFILLAPFLAGVSAFAQLPTGTFLGTVKDSSGALIPGANVTAREQETRASRSIATDSSGEYRLAGLPPGHYDLTVDAAGFKTATETGVVLDVSSQVSLNFDLQVGTTTQKVVVSGEAPLVDTTSASLGGLVNEEKIEDLPLNGRNFLDLALQQPGISQDTVLVDSGGGTQGTVFSSNGAPIISNNFLLDGRCHPGALDVQVQDANRLHITACLPTICVISLHTSRRSGPFFIVHCLTLNFLQVSLCPLPTPANRFRSTNRLTEQSNAAGTCRKCLTARSATLRGRRAAATSRDSCFREEGCKCHCPGGIC